MVRLSSRQAHCLCYRPDMGEATQVLRIEIRPELGGALHLHIVGQIRPNNARPRAGLPPVIVLADDLDQARAAAAAATIPKRGRKPSPCVDMLIAGPPPIDGPDAWPVERVEAWARDSLAWIGAGLGDRSVISAAAIHLDERSPHLHVSAIPIDATGRLGWGHVRRDWARSTYHAGRSSRRDASGELVILQDRYHRDVAERYGLDRGERGSARKHRAVDRVAGAETRAADVVETARRELGELDALGSRGWMGRRVARGRKLKAQNQAVLERVTGERDAERTARHHSEIALASLNKAHEAEQRDSRAKDQALQAAREKISYQGEDLRETRKDSEMFRRISYQEGAKDAWSAIRDYVARYRPSRLPVVERLLEAVREWIATGKPEPEATPGRRRPDRGPGLDDR